MTEPSSMKDWQLEESTDARDQWQLLDTEQELPSELTLQGESREGQTWQPVDYASTQPSGGRNWLLPTFIIVAMVAVVGYIAWLGFSGIGLLPDQTAAIDPTQPVEEPDAGVIIAAPDATEAPTPTATEAPAQAPEPAVPTPAPTPTAALVEQQFAVINSPLGLNARLAAGGVGEVVEVLDDGAVFAVVEPNPEWTQIQLEDGRQVFVSTEFITVTTEMVSPDQAINPPVAEAAGPDDAVAAPAPQRTLEPAPPEPFTNVVPPGPAALILVAGGVNARTEPAVDGELILTIPQGAALTAVGRNAANDWLQIELPTGALAWVFAELVETSGALDTLEVTDGSAPLPATPAPEETAAEAAPTPAATVSAEAPAAAVDPEVTVDSLISIKARQAPALDAEVLAMLANGTVLPATGRSADGTWIQVQLEDGQAAWLLSGAVILNADSNTLPVTEP